MEFDYNYDTEFVEKFEPLALKNSEQPNIDNILRIYYEYIEEYFNKEEEYNLDVWSSIVKNILIKNNKLFMAKSDIVSLMAYTAEDKNEMSLIIAELIKNNKLVSYQKILKGTDEKKLKQKSNYFDEFLLKIINTFKFEGDDERPDGPFWLVELLEEIAIEIEYDVICTSVTSERRIRDYLYWKYSYHEIDAELILMHMKNK